MPTLTDVIVIGAGQAGLAASRCLTDLGIDHRVLEKGAIGNRWRTERWASLRMLTPNWMSRLPGQSYDGDAPDGFMHKDEVTGYLARYARGFVAPVREYTSVISVTRRQTGFRVVTSRDTYHAKAVVVASGACDLPNVPAWASALPAHIRQVTTRDYLRPDDLGTGGVLVVGGSATGVQLAREIHQSGRPVTLASGSHTYLPRRYRGADIMVWMDRIGLLSEARDTSAPNGRAMHQPSLQLIGDPAGGDINLGTLRDEGIDCLSRVTGCDGASLKLSGGLAGDMARARVRCERVLRRIDAHIERLGTAAPAGRIVHPAPPRHERDCVSLARAGIETVVWATGYRRRYPWLDMGVTDAQGEIRQWGGVTEIPGLYALGLPFMRRRNSAFLDGVGADARDIVTFISKQLGHSARLAA